ncbi:MAG: alpha/beta hydrolase, partial [Acutalibacteraceae bacterium]|nr:alpha/beta hydrolase [Acutalibacteraceae bacterium]
MGLKTEYEIWGEGDIPVLLLHGWGASFDTFRGIVSALSDRCKLYAVNFPGCGNSQVMPEPWNL